MSKRRRLLRYALAMCGAILSVTPAMAQTDVHVLDVGQGLSVLVESQGHRLLYDGGNRDKSSYVVAYLQQHGVSDLDYMIASHYDADHINGLVGALNTTPVKQFFGPDYVVDTKVFNSLQDSLVVKGVPKEQPAVGSSYALGDATFQVLAPSGSGYSDANNYSIVIRVVDGDTSFLITGDAEQEAEQEICNSGLALDSNVYVMGHHGSGSSTNWDLLQKVTPEYAVLSCGSGNSYGHPHVESMEKLQTMEIQLLRTDKQGALVATTDGHTITWDKAPCNDYTPGNSNDVPAQPAATAQNQAVTDSQVADNVTYEYVLNTSTKKMHRPFCDSVDKIKDSNRKTSAESRDALISQGYVPCKKCNP